VTELPGFLLLGSSPSSFAPLLLGLGFYARVAIVAGPEVELRRRYGGTPDGVNVR
jgi:hypothetical protein